MKKRAELKKETKNELLFDIWEYYEMKNTISYAEELKYVKEAEECEEKLLVNLGEKEKILFEHFNDSLSELSYLSRRNAFIQGIKFATKYLLEVFDNY